MQLVALFFQITNHCTIKKFRWNWTLVLFYLFVVKKRTDLYLDNHRLDQSDIVLRTYTGENLSVLGTVDVDVNCEGQIATLPLVVAEGHGASLFGCN